MVLNVRRRNPVCLGQLERLRTLVLDGNRYTSHVKFPFMAAVTALCVNKNNISNLPVFVDEVRRKFPNIKSVCPKGFHSLVGCRSGGTK